MKSFLLIFFSVVCFKVQAQIEIDSTKYYDFYNLGTVKKISNDSVCAVIVFISGPSSSWTPKERKYILKRDESTFSEFRRNLKKFNIDFKVKFHVVNPVNDFKVDSVFDWSKITGYKKGDNIKRDFNTENANRIWEFYSNDKSLPFFKDKQYLNYQGGYFLLIYHHGMGRTNASPYFTFTDKNTETPEHLTVFQETLNRQKVKKRTTVHEALHLFGAWDLYNDDYHGHDKQTYDKIKEKFPKSIMRNLNYSTIDPITAWRIGLNNKPENWFFDVVPKAYNKSFYDSTGKFKF